MKSRITIEIDFEDNSPFIQVINNHQSPDVRDKLITQFRQLLGHSSSWLKVYLPYYHDESDSVLMVIKPIKPDELKSESKKMLEVANFEKT